MRKRLLTWPVLALVLSLAPAHAGSPRPQGRIVIPGTLGWNIGEAEPVVAPAELWWNWPDYSHAQLVPQRGARLRLIELADDDDCGLAAQEASLSAAPIPLYKLKPGRLLAMRTSKGALFVARVVGLSDSHDFSFKLPAGADGRAKLLQERSVVRDYNLQLQWKRVDGAMICHWDRW